MKKERHARIDLRKLREERGWLQWEAADKLGISRSYLSGVENNKRGVSLSLMESIIRVFGIKYEDFYDKNTGFGEN